MRHPPMMVPKGRLQICCKFCQVSASCHINAMTPNSTADAPRTIRPASVTSANRFPLPSGVVLAAALERIGQIVHGHDDPGLTVPG
jgi:hypothetical protein